MKALTVKHARTDYSVRVFFATISAILIFKTKVEDPDRDSRGIRCHELS